MRKQWIFGSMIFLGSSLLVGCGVSGNSAATPAHAISGGAHKSGIPDQTSSSSPSSPPSLSTSSPGPSSSSPTITPQKIDTTSHSSSVAPNILSSITYTANQQANIFEIGRQAGFPAAYIPREGFHSEYVKATVFTAATSHGTVLMLSYNNFVIQESAKADSFGTGGDHATTGSLPLTIPGSGSQTPRTGTWITDYGIQGSGMHSFLTFQMNGVYCDIMSPANTLSETQITKIAESLSES